MNYQIEEFYNNLINLVNHCGLPIGVARFVLKDCLNQLEIGYREAIKTEASSQEQDEEIIINKDTLPKIENDIEGVKECNTTFSV